MGRDNVNPINEAIATWKREFPELELTGVTLLLEASALMREIEIFNERVLESFGVLESDYRVLEVLRQAGPPYRLNPKRLIEALGASSGGLAKRLKKVEAAGWVTRRPDPEDGRGLQVVLTRRGLELQGRIFVTFVSAAESQLGAVSEDECRAAGAAMARLTGAFRR